MGITVHPSSARHHRRVFSSPCRQRVRAAFSAPSLPEFLSPRRVRGSLQGGSDGSAPATNALARYFINRAQADLVVFAREDREEDRARAFARLVRCIHDRDEHLHLVFVAFPAEREQ